MGGRLYEINHSNLKMEKRHLEYVALALPIAGALLLLLSFTVFYSTFGSPLDVVYLFLSFFIGGIPAVLAVILCAHIKRKFKGKSVIASAALGLSIPYLVAILLCVVPGI